MVNLTRHKSNEVVRRPDGNPEGKGLNGFLLDWYRSEPRGIVAKTGRQVLAEFFTSMLVLSAHFKYKPAVGVVNYLYWTDEQWSLSLIAPEEWSSERQAGFVGTCTLQRDMTWTIEPSENLGGENAVTEALAGFYRAFADTLDTDTTLEDILPFCVRKMPYYQRLYASALSRSIRETVNLGDQTSLRCRDWRSQLPKLDRLLLSRQEID